MSHHLPFYHNNSYVAKQDNTRVHVPKIIEVEKEQPWVDHFGNPNGTIYDPLVGNNPNNQWISGASNQMYASPKQKQSSQDYAQHFIGAVTPVPVLEGINLTAKGARIPGLIDDAILKPVLSGVKSIKSFISPKFVSEVDWAKWNKAIPENKELLDEYHLIEQTAKKNKTWMKNPDGSDFAGSPEQFVQVNSGNFKTAYPKGYESVYRGVDNNSLGHVNEKGQLRSKDPYKKSWLGSTDIRDTYTGMFTGDKVVANSYTSKDGNLLNLAMKNSDNSLKIEGLGNWHNDLTTIGSSKQILKKNIDNLKKSVKEGEVPDYNDASSKAARLESYENFYNNYDEIVSNPIYKKLVKYKEDLIKLREKHHAPGAGLFDTDDLAQFLEKEGIDNIQLNYIDDNMMGKTNISNQVSGNYLKSLEGNDGMFDLTNKDIFKKHGGPVSEYTDGTNITAQIQPLTSFQSQETPYQDLNWLQKANYGFSENMYNKPMITGNAPGGGVLGKLSKTWDGIKKVGNLAEEYVPKTVSSEAAFAASDNRINEIAEQTGTATTHGSIGVGNGMYMENPATFEDGDKVESPKVDWGKLYEGIARREHRGYWGTDGYNPYIRTKGTKGQRSGDARGSTAYGPLQITADRLSDLNQSGRRRFYWNDPTADYPEDGGISWDEEYVDQLKEQGRLFSKYGGADMPEGGIDPETKEDVSRYDYGQPGDLTGEEYHAKYKDLSIAMLKGTYNILKNDLKRDPTMEELVTHWRGGTKDEEPEYVKDVVKYYNSTPKTDFTKVMGSTTYKEDKLPTGPSLIFPKASENKKDGGYTYAREGKSTSRYMKAYEKFNNGGNVGNTNTDQFTGWVKNRQAYTPEGIHPKSDREMIFKNHYNTELTDKENKDFLLWATTWKNPGTGNKLNMMDEGAYDVRGFWKSGDWKKTDSRGHGSDMWKKPNHPTFSEESVYSKQKEGSEYDGGVWMDDGAFVPGYHNMHSNERLLWEFNRDEGDEHLIGSYVLPEVSVTP